MISADHPGQQKHGSQLHANHVGAEERHSNFLRPEGARAKPGGSASRQVGDFREEYRG